MIQVFKSAPGASRICDSIETALAYMSDDELRGLAEWVKYKAFLRQRSRDINSGVEPEAYEDYQF